MPFAESIKIFCFAASYACAFGFELWHQLRPRPILRAIGLCFGAAGLFAHSLFILFKPSLLSAPFGSLMVLGWVLAVFYLYGSLHHRRVTWGLFVLPLVLGLTALAYLFPPGERLFWRGSGVWGVIHGGMVLLAAVGVCVGFVASVMYLVQAHRLKVKAPPGHGIKLLSLERLETMNRRAVTWAFPLLTTGLLVGVILLVNGHDPLKDWSNAKFLSVIGLWVVVAILVYLRYAVHARGRQTAIWTIVAFGLMVISLALFHPLLPGGPN